MQTTLGDEMALTHNLEVGECTNVKGAHQSVSIRATNMFLKEDGNRKMIGHDVDVLSFLSN